LKIFHDLLIKPLRFFLKMNEVPLLDYQEGVINYGDDGEAFKMILNLFDEESLNQNALRLHKGIMKMDFEEIRLGAYFVKGSAMYISAPKLKNVATELQRKGDVKESMRSILKDYIEFLTIVRELKKEIAIFLERPVSLNIIDLDIFETQVRATFPDDFKIIKED